LLGSDKVNSYIVVASIILILMSGCSTTSVKFYAKGMTPPLCHPNNAKTQVLVYWGTAWRADQKEIEKREDMAEKAITDFFLSQECLSTLSISKTLSELDAMTLSDVEIIKTSQNDFKDVEKIFVIRVEELGPNIMIYLSPILWETRNDVFFNIRVLDVKTGRLEANISTHWEHGGPFTLFGARSLSADFSRALTELFFGNYE